jgi:hypothetical protein
MKPEQDWEDALRQGLYDLPKERWARLEADLVRRIREPASEPGWRERLAGLWRGIFASPVRVSLAGGMASLFLAMGWWYLHEHRTPAPLASLPILERWEPGTVLHSDTLRTLAWNAARCTLSLQGDIRRVDGTQGAHLRLEKGRVRFGVQPRKLGEVFAVEFGQCRATVVGTAFTLSVDSTGSQASVEHGKVKVETASGWRRYLTKGESWSCREPEGQAEAAPAVQKSASPAASVPPRPVALAAVTPSADDVEWARLQKLCAGTAPGCVEGLAAWLEKRPEGVRSGQAALLWADRSQAVGDFRDALYALDLAANARAGEISFQARLRSCTLKARELKQTDLALKELDALLATLPEGTRRTQARQLRETLAGGENASAPGRSDLP